MALFPLFVDLKDKEVLVVGGGPVALRKVESLLPFGAKVTVVAPRTVPELKKLQKEGKIRLKRRRFLTGDLRGKFMVVVAADDEKLQRRIFALCEKRGIWCNSVDRVDYCNFVFPALVKRGELVVGLTTSGRAPALSSLLRRELEGFLPPKLEKLVEKLYGERKRLPKGRRRREHLRRLAKSLWENLKRGKF
ncbi:MAG: bifunctional precorrin-2 dehydrogenase/sirohydrochlorin ferrochelatase [Aquificae bacterium]|nr:bifunctional precorrin-2 dehydrogenase/sirohydrochlorin ferrochelatase [Aquificota bacterium]